MRSRQIEVKSRSRCPKVVEIHHFDQIHSFEIVGGVHPISTVGKKVCNLVQNQWSDGGPDQVKIEGPGKNGGACA